VRATIEVACREFECISQEHVRKFDHHSRADHAGGHFGERGRVFLIWSTLALFSEKCMAELWQEQFTLLWY
jgi:hypothetical protein